MAASSTYSDSSNAFGSISQTSLNSTCSSRDNPTKGQDGRTTSEPRRGGGQNRGRHSKNFIARGRGGGRGGNQNKKRDLGRSQFDKQQGNRREKNNEEQAAKRQKIADGDDRGLPVYATKFSEQELKDEERRPKKKVAVLIGYSGTGYKGMQLTHDQKTIEGDLFKAFVAAGAISKANADDPKKSSFVRCARTDKGVHAAGNVISLKLIVEDEDIVQKINDNLAPQIRVWGYERTSNSFSAYQMVDSRIYEYLIPSHAFLPPHPRSYLGRKCKEWAEKKGDTEAWESRQREVDGYWDKVDEGQIRPILMEYNEDIRNVLEKALWLEVKDESMKQEPDQDYGIGDRASSPDATAESSLNDEESQPVPPPEENEPSGPLENSELDIEDNTASSKPQLTLDEKKARTASINEAVKRLRQAYITAKRAYRIDETRLQRVRDALELYVGTRNYHNYTILKKHSDPSANRLIKSFVVHGSPILIKSSLQPQPSSTSSSSHSDSETSPSILGATEWLSLKVHGQSFMMHQIRKMVGMASLVVRCGADPQAIIPASYGPNNISIPKAPSLGLLLERPVFDTYNRKATSELKKEGIGFQKYEKIMDEFKQKEIYDRMHADEEKDNLFGNFYSHIDNFPNETFLFVTSGGVEATKVEGKDAVNASTKMNGPSKQRDDDNNEDEDLTHDINIDSDSDADVKDGAGNEG